ncbi:MAG: lipopolysaccharide heptosyltransferase I [Pseudomonadota bacterium]|nr:lipopolysaccharide heptosyltransferase I [Pseudomonadota bacterium]MDP1905724.1 lipopolysaccharide heptosyltransferase I [Pseudomonadota bacterium]MDP2353596.1 lipopolysaccharide heptosyltransferase I [Pseudomonadota bacterium]
MNLLVIKMTSLGDVVHLLPALSEAAGHVPDLRVDWVVEEGFAAIPAWHPVVARVIPSALRRWRRNLGQRATWAEIATFRHTLQTREYDLVLDAQGLIKSAWVASLARGPRAGLARGSAREPLACLAYARRYLAPRELHAISRNRLLAAQALGYPMGAEAGLRYGVTAPAPYPVAGLAADYVVCLHGTARAEKEYPESDWMDLLARITALGLGVALPWGNAREKARAERLAANLAGAIVLPKLGLAELGGLIAAARGVIGVDTGLMHLAAAFRKPGVGLYPATPPARFGAYAEADAPALINLSRPEELTPAAVATTFSRLFPGHSR